MLAKLVRILSGIQQYGVIYTPSQLDDRRVDTKEIHNVNVAKRLIDAGVTIQEWKPVSDPPKKAGRYLIYTTQYFIPDHVDDPDHVDGMEISGYYPQFGFLSKNGLHAKYWTYLPTEPKDVAQNEKCCYDCISCIPSNAPIEAGIQHVCVNTKGERGLENSVDPWSAPCDQFMARR